MILRHLTDALRKQDWFTVVIETLIVVFGVFIGLQVNNWNESRAEKERAQEYLARIRTDLVADMTQLKRHQEFWQDVADNALVAVRFAETGETDGVSDWQMLLAYLNASQAWQSTFIDTTYSELRTSANRSSCRTLTCAMRWPTITSSSPPGAAGAAPIISCRNKAKWCAAECGPISCATIGNPALSRARASRFSLIAQPLRTRRASARFSTASSPIAIF